MTTPLRAPHSPRTRKEAAQRGVIGPYSRLIDRGAVGGINACSREGRFLRHYEAMLIEHVGGAPTVTQRALIARASRLALHLELLDEKTFIDGHALTPTDCHFYGVWANSLARHLEKLGLQPSAAKQPADPMEPLRRHLEERARERENEAA